MNVLLTVLLSSCVFASATSGDAKGVMLVFTNLKSASVVLVDDTDVRLRLETMERGEKKRIFMSANPERPSEASVLQNCVALAAQALLNPETAEFVATFMVDTDKLPPGRLSERDGTQVFSANAFGSLLEMGSRANFGCGIHKR